MAERQRVLFDGFVVFAAPGSSLIIMGKLHGALKRKDNLHTCICNICFIVHPATTYTLLRYVALREDMEHALNALGFATVKPSLCKIQEGDGEETAAFMYPPFCPGLTSVLPVQEIQNATATDPAYYFPRIRVIFSCLHFFISAQRLIKGS